MCACGGCICHQPICDCRAAHTVAYPQPGAAVRRHSHALRIQHPPGTIPRCANTPPPPHPLLVSVGNVWTCARWTGVHVIWVDATRSRPAPAQQILKVVRCRHTVACAKRLDPRYQYVLDYKGLEGVAVSSRVRLPAYSASTALLPLATRLAGESIRPPAAPQLHAYAFPAHFKH